MYTETCKYTHTGCTTNNKININCRFYKLEVGDGATVVSDGIMVENKKLNDDCEEEDNGGETVDKNNAADDVGPNIVDSMTGSI